MSFTYDVTTDAGKVRLIITDTDASLPIFQDAEVDAFLSLQGGSIVLAAAQAMDTIASSEALVLKKIRLLDVTTDGPAVAKALREHAKALREEALNQDGGFDIAEMILDPWSANEYYLNLAARRML